MKKRPMGLWYVLAVIAVLAADQGLKFWTVANIPLNAAPADQIPMIPGIVHLTYIRNTGAAFGMMKGGRWLFLLLPLPLLFWPTASITGKSCTMFMQKHSLTL